jgi:hypothetical protein
LPGFPALFVQWPPWKGNGNMVDRKHYSAIADLARATLQSLRAFLDATPDRKGTHLSDELWFEFTVRWGELRQRLIDADCYNPGRLTVFPPEETRVYAALRTLVDDVWEDPLADARAGREGLEPEVFADHLDAVVTALTEFRPAPPPADSTATPPGLDPTRFRRGPDYADCTWNGKRHTFAPAQRACVKVLWEAFVNGTPEVGQSYVLAEAGYDSTRLQDVFKGNDAWKTMIVKGLAKDTFRLAEPP